MLCEFERFVPPPLYYEQFSAVFELWLSQLIDQLNLFLEDLETCMPIQYAGSVNNGGGSATIDINVSGVTTSDLPDAVIQQSTNAVQVQTVQPLADKIRVTLTGDPGINTVISYFVVRPPS